MKANLAKNRIFALIAVLVVATSAFCAMLLPTCGVAYATKWGNTDTSELIYYNDGFLDVQGAKAVVDTWDKSKVTAPIVIAIIDTGIDLQHELFDGVLVKNANGDVLGYNTDGANPDGSVDISDHSSKHGSEIAGVVAMLIKEFGLEQYIKIYPIKANNKGENKFNISNLTKALDWAVTKAKADVINMSLGYSKRDYESQSSSLRGAFEVALSKAEQTAVVVAAAGNRRAINENRNQAFYPASLEGVVSVANEGNDGKIYSTSYYHDTTDICAPGQAIYTSKGFNIASKYGTADGTSLSAASVSFASALLKMRLIVEGKATQAQTISRMISRLPYPKNVVVSDYTFPALNLKTVVQTSLDSGQIDLGYKAPTGISLAHNGTIGTGDYTGLIYMRADSVTPVEFIAKLTPLGAVDPEIENSMEWTVQTIKDADDYTVMDEQSLGTGAIMTFKAPRGGDYIVKAKLPYYDFEATQQIHVEFAQYYVGEVRVTLADKANLDVDDAPSRATLYTKETTRFALTGVQYLNPYTETKWFVNGKYVASGATFDFKPNKAGTYYITAQFGDAKVDFGYKFTAEVKSFILRPLDLSLLIVGCTLALGAAIAVTVVVVKKKKHAALETESEKEE